MKIGILTLWKTEENYGAVLQCYALIKFFQSQGHSVKLIKNKDNGIVKNTLFHKLITMLTMLANGVSLRKKSNKITRNVKVVKRGFSDFFEKYIPSYSREYTSEELNSAVIDADMLVCGSDQVWSTISPIYYLQIKGNFIKVAYAASFGGFEIINPLDRIKVSKWMKSFDLITVRELEGVEKCLKLNCKATVVPDPTLLLEKSDYLSIASQNYINCEESYILLYLLGNPIDLEVKEIMEFAAKNNLKVKYIASHGREDEFDKIYPTIEQWLTLMNNAKYVITNSFHGSVFALIFEKPFLTIPLIGSYSRMNGRIEDLLRMAKLTDRIYNGDLSMLFNSIEFHVFNEVKKNGRKKVLSLMNNIGNHL